MFYIRVGKQFLISNFHLCGNLNINIYKYLYQDMEGSNLKNLVKEMLLHFKLVSTYLWYTIY